MSKTSTAVKQKYLDKTYIQFSCRIRPELAEQLAEYMAENNLSRSEFLKAALSKLKGENKMYCIVMNNGEYQELPKAQTYEQAEAEMHLRYTKEQIESLEMEITE